jgi:UDP-galactopyranose mutase
MELGFSKVESMQTLHANDVETQLRAADLVVVGSGFFGATIAERVASDSGCRVVVLERRSHIGGNAWSEFEPSTGIEIHKYGSHLFHTSSDQVWAYANRFTTFNGYEHQVWTTSGGRVYPLPFSLATINTLLGTSLSPRQAADYLASVRLDIPNPSNLKEKALATIGPDLYEALVSGYTTKQWQKDPADLPAETIARLPVRLNYNLRYFEDKYEGLPTVGYGPWLEAMLTSPQIHVALEADFFDFRQFVPAGTPVVYSGPLDRFFDFRLGELTWRTLDFEWEVLSVGDFQGLAVMNYADNSVPYTRIHEFRHLHPERNYPLQNTVIAREFSRRAEGQDEPYYPVNTERDRKRLKGYRELASGQSDVIFGGRLGTYKYLDMHMAIASALSTYNNDVRPRLMP